MRGNPGLLCKIDGGGKAIAYHKEQEKQFAELKKHFIHYLDEDMHPILDENGKPKTGLIASSKLKLMGYVD